MARRKAFAASEKQKFVDNAPVTKTALNETKPSLKLVETEIEKNFKHFIPLVKANTEKRTVTGVVLQPEVVDAQGDIYSEEVVEKAANDFLAGFRKKTKLGFMHKIFNKKFELLQSYIAPQNLVINGQTVAKGSWVMVVKVVDDAVWKLVKAGKIKGFSIGGKAKVIETKAAA